MSGQHDLFAPRSFTFNPREAFHAPSVEMSAGLRAAPQAADPETMAGRVAAFFRGRPDEWIDGRELMTVAGSYGWRTRVSDIRRAPYNMRIDNRQRRVGRFVVSEYRYVPAGADVDLGGAA